MVFISPLLFSIKQSYLSGLDDPYLVYLLSFWLIIVSLGTKLG